MTDAAPPPHGAVPLIAGGVRAAGFVTSAAPGAPVLAALPQPAALPAEPNKLLLWGPIPAGESRSALPLVTKGSTNSQKAAVFMRDAGGEADKTAASNVTAML
jgi:hypothetical protein